MGTGKEAGDPQEDSTENPEKIPFQTRSCRNSAKQLNTPPLDLTSAIQAGFSRGYPLSLRERLFLGLVACCLVGLFVIASTLDPESRGYGTHEQLGLPPCSLRTILGIPCPTCGMTTCFAHLVRGNVTNACRANPAGLLVALCCLICIPWSVASVMKGRLWYVTAPVETMIALMMALVGVSLTVWVIQVLP